MVQNLLCPKSGHRFCFECLAVRITLTCYCLHFTPSYSQLLYLLCPLSSAGGWGTGGRAQSITAPLCHSILLTPFLSSPVASLSWLQGTPCPGACSTSSSSSPCSDLGARRAVSHTFFLTLCSVLPFLQCAFPEAPSASLRGSAVPCGGAVGTGWNRLCPVWGSPGFSSQRRLHPPSCQCLGTGTQCSCTLSRSWQRYLLSMPWLVRYEQ